MRHKSKSTTLLYEDYRLNSWGPSVLVVGSSSLVRDIAVINSPGVEPLELPAIKSRQSEIRGQHNSAVCLTCFCSSRTDPPSGF